MTYQWNGAALGGVFALPNTVADRALKMAGAAQLKVLLWWARHGEFDESACAAATGLSPADCRDAMSFWCGAGVLERAGESENATVEETEKAPIPHTLPPAAEIRRGQLPDALARQRSDPKFDCLLKTAEQRIGAPLTPGDMESFLYMYDQLGLPAEVIVMIVVNAVQEGKVHARSSFRKYVERIAESWAREGIVTVAAAEALLCRRERIDAVGARMKQLFSLQRAPTLAAKEEAVRWFDEWGFSDEVLLIAAAKCREATGNFNANYMSRILESWYADGVTTPQQAKEAAAPKRRAAGKPLLSESAEKPAAQTDYEQALANWRPVYTKE